jgi:hypothetical protein
MTLSRFAATALFLSVCLCGCVVVSESPRRPQWSDDQTVIAEIDAASRLMFDDARAGALMDIASRRHLSARAQVHLVRTAMDSLMFDNAKQKVMLALIDNPYFVNEGKKAVLEQVDEFMFDSSRQSILHALSRRGTLPSEDELNSLMNSQHPLPLQSSVETELTVEFSASYGSSL